MNAILTMSSIIFPVDYIPLRFQYPDAGGMGKVSFAVSLITYFNMLQQLGIPILMAYASALWCDNKEELTTRTAHELLR